MRGSGAMLSEAFVDIQTRAHTCYRRTDIDLNVYFRLKGPENPRICGNLYKIVVNQCRLNVRINLFSERVAVAWNSLAPSLVNFWSLQTFRRTI